MAKPADLTILPNPKGLSLANALRRKYPRIRCASTGMPARSSPRGNSMLLSHRQGACYRTHLLSSARSRVPAGLKCPRLPKPKPPIPHHPPYFHSPGPRRAAATIGTAIPSSRLRDSARIETPGPCTGRCRRARWPGFPLPPTCEPPRVGWARPGRTGPSHGADHGVVVPDSAVRQQPLFRSETPKLPDSREARHSARRKIERVRACSSTTSPARRSTTTCRDPGCTGVRPRPPDTPTPSRALPADASADRAA